MQNTSNSWFIASEKTIKYFDIMYSDKIMLNDKITNECNLKTFLIKAFADIIDISQTHYADFFTDSTQKINLILDYPLHKILNFLLYTIMLSDARLNKSINKSYENITFKQYKERRYKNRIEYLNKNDIKIVVKKFLTHRDEENLYSYKQLDIPLNMDQIIANFLVRNQIDKNNIIDYEKKYDIVKSAITFFIIKAYYKSECKFNENQKDNDDISYHQFQILQDKCIFDEFSLNEFNLNECILEEVNNIIQNIISPSVVKRVIQLSKTVMVSLGNGCSIV